MTHVIDMHCDTLMKSFLDKGDQSDVYSCPEYSIDVKRLLKGGAMAQFFAIFIPPEEMYRQMHHPVVPEDDYIEGLAKVFHNTVNKHLDVMDYTCNADDIERNWKDGKLSAVLSMEDGVAVHGDMKKLDHYYEMGVRALSLTWNFKNCFGSPNSKDPGTMAEGLTEFGKKAVKHMQEIGMLVDVSHVSDGVFWDVYRLAEVSFVATHSNCRAVCSHTRNMSDDMIRALHEKGGVMGINFSPKFLDETPGNRESRIDDMVQMALHEKEIAGVDVIAIGSDLDGIGGNLEIQSPDQMPLLFDALVKAGFTAKEVDQIAYENVLRVMHEAVR